MFLERLKELQQSGARCAITTPFGFSVGKVIECTDACFRFESEQGQKFTLYVEDLLFLSEGE